MQTLNHRSEQIHTVYHALEALQTEVRQTAGDRELMVRQVTSLKKNYQEWLVSEALGDHGASARWASELHATCQSLQSTHPAWKPLLESIGQQVSSDITPQSLPAGGAHLERGSAEVSTAATHETAPKAPPVATMLPDISRLLERENIEQDSAIPGEQHLA